MGCSTEGTQGGMMGCSTEGTQGGTLGGSTEDTRDMDCTEGDTGDMDDTKAEAEAQAQAWPVVEDAAAAASRHTPWMVEEASEDPASAPSAFPWPAVAYPP